MPKRTNLEKILFKNKEKHLHKKKVCQNNREISKECSKINIGSKLWMQLKDKIKMSFKIYCKRKTFSKIITTTYIHKNFTKKNRLISKKLKIYHLNRWKKLNYKKMSWVDKIFSIN
jgi:hypothetical protein